MQQKTLKLALNKYRKLRIAEAENTKKSLESITAVQTQFTSPATRILSAQMLTEYYAKLAVRCYPSGVGNTD